MASSTSLCKKSAIYFQLLPLAYIELIASKICASNLSIRKINYPFFKFSTS